MQCNVVLLYLLSLSIVTVCSRDMHDAVVIVTHCHWVHNIKQTSTELEVHTT